jgi:hypothetical protein
MCVHALRNTLYEDAAKSKEESVHTHVFLTYTHVKHRQIKEYLVRRRRKVKGRERLDLRLKGLRPCRPKENSFLWPEGVVCLE